MSRICVLLATFNGVKYLDDQIKTILGQRRVQVIIFASDDLSTDGTLQILKSYENNTNFFLLENKVRHGSAGKNFFSMLQRIDFEPYDYIAFSDQDDLWDLDKLNICATYLNSNPGFVGASSCVHAFWPDGRITFVNKVGRLAKYDYFFEAGGPGCSYLVTSKFALKIRSLLLKKPWIYRRVALHDWLMYAYARYLGERWTILPNSTLMYRQHDSNEIGVNKGIFAMLVRFKKMRSGWYLDQVYAVSEAVGAEEKLKLMFTSRGKPSFFFFLNFLKMRRRFIDSVFLLFALLFRFIK